MISNIVLVHGAQADGSGWEGVHNILTEKDLMSLVVPNPNTSLADDVKLQKQFYDCRMDQQVLRLDIHMEEQ